MFDAGKRRRRRERHGLAHRPLDVPEQRCLIRGDQRHGMAVIAGARRAANAMHVILRHMRHVVIDDLRQFADVETARRDLGCDQCRQLAGLEIGERAGPRGLALVAVDRRGTDAGAPELLGEAVRAVLGAREHEGLVPAAFAVGAVLEQVHQQVPLVVLVHAKGDLHDLFHRAVRRGDLDLHWLHEDSRGQRADIRRIGRREQEVLAFGRQQLDDPLDVVDESHVQHAVGFVQHEMLHLREIRVAPLGKVEQPARGRHEDVAAIAQPVDLRLLADAAEDHARAQVLVGAVDADALEDLGGEFARGREDQCARRAACGGREQLQQRENESGRLARAGLGAGQQVATGEHRRYRLRLDRRRQVVAVAGHGGKQPGLKP